MSKKQRVKHRLSKTNKAFKQAQKIKFNKKNIYPHIKKYKFLIKRELLRRKLLLEEKQQEKEFEKLIEKYVDQKMLANKSRPIKTIDLYAKLKIQIVKKLKKYHKTNKKKVKYILDIDLNNINHWNLIMKIKKLQKKYDKSNIYPLVNHFLGPKKECSDHFGWGYKNIINLSNRKYSTINFAIFSKVMKNYSYNKYPFFASPKSQYIKDYQLINDLSQENKDLLSTLIEKLKTSDNKTIGWKDFSKVYSDLTQSNEIISENYFDLKCELSKLKYENTTINRNCENLKSELFILREQHDDLIMEYNNDTSNLERMYRDQKNNAYYQRKKKIKARKDYFKLNERYKKSMTENMTLQEKLDNIEKRIKGITKNTPIDIYKYFKDFFPKVELKHCPICCDKFPCEQLCKCVNEKCSVLLCKNCDKELDQCPYCRQEKQTNDNDKDIDCDNDYESEYEDEEYDYIISRHYDNTNTDENISNFNTIFQNSDT